MATEQDFSHNMNKTQGCGSAFLFTLTAFWLILVAAIDLFICWSAEQTLFQSSTGIPDFRLLTHSICSVLIVIPTVLLGFLVKNPGYKKIYRLWMYSGFLCLLALPMKQLFLTAQNETSLYQIFIISILLIGYKILHKPSSMANEENKNESHLIGIVVMMGAVLAIPWLLWGALGSFVDTILGILVGALFGAMVVILVFPVLFDKSKNSSQEITIAEILVNGLVVSIFFLICVAALAHNGSQLLLVTIVPVMGWLVAIIAMVGRQSKTQSRIATGILSGSLFCLPLIFFDMDELAEAILGGTGEVLDWATKAATYTSIGIIIFIVLGIITSRLIKKIKPSKQFNILLTFVGTSSIFLVYFIWGQVGFFGDTQFVILKEQADLSSSITIEDYQERRQNVYDTMVETAESSQRTLQAKLDRYHIHYTPYYLVNAIEVKGGSLVRLLLEKDPSVDSILDNPQLRPLPISVEIGEGETALAPEETLWNISMIQADRVIDELNIDGSGIVIGQTDSGVDGNHPELQAAYRGLESGDDYNWFDPWNHTTTPTDAGGHGTQTLGIILGKNIGVAPGAKWIGCANLARNLGSPARYLDCMQFMLAPFPQDGDPFKEGDPDQGAMIVNNSWGCPDVEGCDAEVFESAVYALETAGIFMSSAAGNNGYFGCSSVTDPIAIYEDVFTAGSVNIDGKLSDFSSIGPVTVDGSGRQKPDLLAPGEDILSSYPEGTYSTASGTSFSAPHVSGVVALLWSANPALIGNIEVTSQILRETAMPYEGGSPTCGDLTDAVGSGILDAFAAVQAAMQYQTASVTN